MNTLLLALAGLTPDPDRVRALAIDPDLAPAAFLEAAARHSAAREETK